MVVPKKRERLTMVQEELEIKLDSVPIPAMPFEVF
jgi:hypothetical protein